MTNCPNFRNGGDGERRKMVDSACLTTLITVKYKQPLRTLNTGWTIPRRGLTIAIALQEFGEFVECDRSPVEWWRCLRMCLHENRLRYIRMNSQKLLGVPLVWWLFKEAFPMQKNNIENKTTMTCASKNTVEKWTCCSGHSVSLGASFAVNEMHWNKIRSGDKKNLIIDWRKWNKSTHQTHKFEAKWKRNGKIENKNARAPAESFFRTLSCMRVAEIPIVLERSGKENEKWYFGRSVGHSQYKQARKLKNRQSNCSAIWVCENRNLCLEIHKNMCISHRPKNSCDEELAEYNGLDFVVVFRMVFNKQHIWLGL